MYSANSNQSMGLSAAHKINIPSPPTTGEHAIPKMAIPQRQAQGSSNALSQICSLEVRDYISACHASWSGLIHEMPRMGKNVEEQLRKRYTQEGLKGVDTFIDEVNTELKKLGVFSGIGRGVACEIKDGASDVLHFYMQEFATTRIIGRYRLTV